MKCPRLELATGFENMMKEFNDKGERGGMFIKSSDDRNVHRQDTGSDISHARSSCTEFHKT